MHICFQEFMSKNTNTYWKHKLQKVIEGESHFLKMGGRSSSSEIGRYSVAFSLIIPVFHMSPSQTGTHILKM